MDAEAIELNYKNSKFSFVIVLPNSRTGLSELEKKIKGYGLANIMSQMKKQKTILKLPKFKVEYEIDLRNALENVCIHKIFEIGSSKEKKTFSFVIQLDMRSMYTGGADLSGLLESPAGSLRVSKVIHKAFIDVNEGEI